MATYYRVFLIYFFLSFITSDQVKSQSYQLNSDNNRIDLIDHCYFIKSKIDTIDLSELRTKEWEKSEHGANLGAKGYFYWFKYEIDNTSDSSIESNLFIPYHHNRKLDIYLVKNQDTALIAKYGTSRKYSKKEVLTPSYVKKMKFLSGKSTILIFIDHYNMPLRANCYLVSNNELNDIIRKSENSYNAWFIFILIALGLAGIIYLATKIRLFLLYFILNLGVLLFIGIEIGGFFKFFDIDKYLFFFDIKHLGVIMVLFAFPYFLNELTPIKKLNPKVWQIMLYFLFVSIIFWAIGMINSVKYTQFFNFYVWYLIVHTIMVFAIQLYFLFVSYMHKEKNSLLLLILYFVYIAAVTYEVILPNIGAKTDSIYVYDMLLKSSIVEIVMFSILMGKEMITIFKDRNNLLLKQKELQKDMLRAVVTSQENERNHLGRELHDMIGANMSVVKQKIDKSDENLTKIIDETIDSVRSLSHGLITPKVDGDQFKDEIIDLCLICSNKEFKVNYYFHNWKPINDEEKSTHLYRIIQELLQNTIKHSKASEVYIQFITNEEGLNVIFEDNGIGFDTEKELKKGKGLLGIQHRAEVIQAKLRFETSKKGTSVELKLNYT